MTTIKVLDEQDAVNLMIALSRPGTSILVVGPTYRRVKAAVTKFAKACDEKEVKVRLDVDSVTVNTNGSVVKAVPITRLQGRRADYVIVVGADRADPLNYFKLDNRRIV